MTAGRDGAVWHLAATVADEGAADAVAELFGRFASALSAFEVSPGGAWRVEGFAAAAPDRAELQAELALLAAALDRVDLVADFSVERLAQRDWVAENQASFPPLVAGRFFVHGSHVKEKPPAGRIPLLIDATTAFGTGEHATTRGCLLAIDALARRRRHRAVLDMGTGTGILAVAAARVFAAPVLGCDIDSGSVRVARANVRANGVAARVRMAHTNGYRARIVRRSAPFDLILANILARPLAAMAPSLKRALKPGGVAVLSGLLARQERFVLAAHRAQGLRLSSRRVIDGWLTLVLRK